MPTRKNATSTKNVRYHFKLVFSSSGVKSLSNLLSACIMWLSVLPRTGVFIFSCYTFIIPLQTSFDREKSLGRRQIINPWQSSQFLFISVTCPVVHQLAETDCFHTISNCIFIKVAE